MADGNQGAFLASSGRQPFILGGEIGVLGFRRDLGNFDEALPQPAIAFARLPTSSASPTLVSLTTDASFRFASSKTACNRLSVRARSWTSVLR